MTTPKGTEVLEWMKTTDLVEVAWKRGAAGFAFSLAGAPAPAPSPAVKIPMQSAVPVTSPAVGFYHAATPGKTRTYKPGEAVVKDGALGYLEAGPKRWDVKSPCAGTITQVLIEEGQAAQYGQPLFILQAE